MKMGSHFRTHGLAYRFFIPEQLNLVVVILSNALHSKEIDDLN